VIKSDLLKEGDFEEIAEVKLDSKHRISLGPKISKRVSSYKVYCNSLGQIILDPLATVPAYELWLFKNKKAAQAVREGLEDARKGRLVKPKEDFTRHLGDAA
jgi:hypothetical protein